MWQCEVVLCRKGRVGGAHPGGDGHCGHAVAVDDVAVYEGGGEEEREAETDEDVEHVAADGVAYGHVALALAGHWERGEGQVSVGKAEGSGKG